MFGGIIVQVEAQTLPKRPVLPLCGCVVVVRVVVHFVGVFLYGLGEPENRAAVGVRRGPNCPTFCPVILSDVSHFVIQPHILPVVRVCVQTPPPLSANDTSCPLIRNPQIQGDKSAQFSGFVRGSAGGYWSLYGERFGGIGWPVVGGVVVPEAVTGL